MTTTTFDPWLNELRAKQKFVPADEVPLAVRGERWDWPLPIEGDWVGSTLVATIRTAPDAGSVLATVAVGSDTYDADADVTTFPLSLASGSGSSPDSTGLLSADSDGDGAEYFPMMVFLTPSGGGVKELLFGCALTLAGKV
ncbi:MAG: hypothetical protein Q8R81_09410 [Novosphingobium sp.]|uniref:hypothetical protein n=1 Tax=Novosphingobium sp. TaxID=1874826 RepID=UPI002732C973|nr:hypothetical protein [Novosphingobium sp.]MDP3550601.1 hypothetical protein [Novosphingobium sp.]